MITFLQDLLASSNYQKLALFFSLIYIVLAVRNNPWCFVFGLLGAIFWALESYLVLALKFDAGLQVFYVAMSIWGLWQWFTEEQTQSRDQTIKTMRWIQHLYCVIIGLVLTLVLALWIAPLINTRMPFLDASTTVFSILATYLLVQRYIENWLYFIVVNSASVYLFTQYDAYLFVIMMAVYLIMSVLGFLNWQKLRNKNTI